MDDCDRLWPIDDLDKTDAAAWETRATAWHEAGHAVVAWALGATVQYVWVADRAYFEAHDGAETVGGGVQQFAN